MTELSQLSVPALRTLSNLHGLSARGGDGKYLPKGALVEQLGGGLLGFGKSALEKKFDAAVKELHDAATNYELPGARNVMGNCGANALYKPLKAWCVKLLQAPDAGARNNVVQQYMNDVMPSMTENCKGPVGSFFTFLLRTANTVAGKLAQTGGARGCGRCGCKLAPHETGGTATCRCGHVKLAHSIA